MDSHRSSTRVATAARRALRLGIAIGASAVSLAAAAHADEPTDAYCRKVEARAASDASLLLAPTVTAQYLRYPANGIADATGVQVGSGWQPRFSASYGLIDAYKGTGVLATGRADCAAETYASELRTLLDASADLGRPFALERQLAVLQKRRPEIEALAVKADERVKREIGTVMDVLDIRKKATEIDREIVALGGELARLRERHVPTVPVTRAHLIDRMQKLDASSAEYDDRVSHVRDLDPWRFNVTGGVVTHPAADYFAAVELSYDIGGIARNGAEAKYREARAEERKTAKGELHAGVTALLTEIATRQNEARQELALLDADAARLDALRTALGSTDAANASQILANLTIESIELDAERTYLASLIAQRSALEESHAAQ